MSEHPLQRRLRGKRRYPVCRVLGLCLIALVTGCGGKTAPPTIHISPVPDLHLPGVAKIPGIDELEARTHTFTIFSLTSYLPTDGTGEARVLFFLGYGPHDVLYDVGLDGTGLRQIPLGTQCFVYFAVTPDGRWVACRNDQGIWFKGLGAQAAESGQQILVRSQDTDLATLAWAPDGQYLAAEATIGGLCRIALYAPSASSSTLRLVALLDLSQLGGNAPPCIFNFPSWSPDERWLTLTGASSNHADTIFVLPYAPIRQQLAHAGSAVLVIPVDPKSLLRLTTQPVFGPPAWAADAKSLVVISDSTRQILQVSVPAGSTTPLLSPPAGVICGGLSWTPVGHHLVFGLCTPVPGDYFPPPAQMYVYTPPSG